MNKNVACLIWVLGKYFKTAFLWHVLTFVKTQIMILFVGIFYTFHNQSLLTGLPWYVINVILFYLLRGGPGSETLETQF